MKLYYLCIILVLILFIGCTSSCSNENNTESNSDNNRTTNNLNNQNPNQNNLDNNNNSNNPNQNNQNSNITNVNENNNITPNITNNPNNNITNNVNNSTNINECIKPTDYEDNENSPIWLRKPGYISRNLCQVNGLAPGYLDGAHSLGFFSEACNGNEDCILPEISESSNDLVLTSEIIAKVSRFNMRENTLDEGVAFFLYIYFLDLSENFEIGTASFGGDISNIEAHIPTDKIIGKKVKFIEKYFTHGVTTSGDFSILFIKDAETDKLIFGTIKPDSSNNNKELFKELLPEFEYYGLYRYREIYEDCKQTDNLQNRMHYYVDINNCKITELGDLIVETDNGKYVIPAQTEGDIKVGSDEYGIFNSAASKRTENACDPENSYSYERYNFYIFDREYFTHNPDYNFKYPECNAME